MIEIIKRINSYNLQFQKNGEQSSVAFTRQLIQSGLVLLVEPTQVDEMYFYLKINNSLKRNS